MNTTTAPADVPAHTTGHTHDFSISISAADVPAYLLPELESFLRSRLAAAVAEQSFWTDVRVDVTYDGRNSCGQHGEMVDVQDENGEWFATYR